MLLSATTEAIEAIRRGSFPVTIHALPPDHAAYIEARVEAHQVIKGGRLTGTAALRLGQTCRLITTKGR